MKLKYNYLISDVAGQTVAVPLDADGSEQSIIKTNETGAFILELLNNEISLEEIITKVKENFEVADDTALNALVVSFIEKLKNAEVLIDE